MSPSEFARVSENSKPVGGAGAEGGWFISESTPGGTRTAGEEIYRARNRTHEAFRQP